MGDAMNLMGDTLAQCSSDGSGMPLPMDLPSRAPTAPSPRTSKEDAAALKKQQQEKLQAAVRDFVRRASGGMPVSLLDATSGMARAGTLTTDEGLRNATITREGSDAALSFEVGRALLLKMPESALRKNPSVQASVQARGNDAEAKMVHIKVDAQNAGGDLICMFDTRADADSFHSCLKVLKMYAQTSAPGAADSKPKIASPT